MTLTVQQMLDEANAVVPKLGVDDARRMLAEKDALLVDLRDSAEIEKTGKLKGAATVSRGMLEFRADAESKYHHPGFDPTRPVIVYCASGGRAALAGKTLTDMGYSSVHNLGGFQQAVDGGMETEEP